MCIIPNAKTPSTRMRVEPGDEAAHVNFAVLQSLAEPRPTIFRQRLDAIDLADLNRTFLFKARNDRGGDIFRFPEQFGVTRHHLVERHISEAIRHQWRDPLTAAARQSSASQTRGTTPCGANGTFASRSASIIE